MITVKQFQYLCKVYSLVACFLFTGMLFYIWYLAYFGGYDAAMVTINDCGEKMVEFYSWFIVLPLIIYGFILNLPEVFYGKGKT